MTDLFSGVRNSSDVEIKRFIETNLGGDVNFKNDEGVSLLHFVSIYAGNAKIIKVLVSMGADVDAKVPNGGTPLHTAKDAEIAKTLVSLGANINAKCNDGRTPLHLAVDNDIVEVVDALAAMGADMNIRAEETNFTPLDMAVALGRVECVKILLSHGANVNSKDLQGFITPLHVAAISKSLAKDKNVEIAKLLISKGADVSARTKSGDTPLDLAIRVTKDLEMFLCLLNYEPIENIGHHITEVFSDINYQADDGWSLLHDAVQDQNVNIVKALVAMGANIHIANKDGITPLDMAVGYGRLEIVEVFLPFVSDINGRDKNNFTLLHKAAFSRKVAGYNAGNNNVKIAKLLLAKGADINIRAEKGTPLDMAKEVGDTEMVNYLYSVIAEKENAEIDRILAVYADTLRDNPNDAKVYIKRGNDFMTHCMADGKKNNVFFDHAIADLTEAIRLDPESVDAYFSRAGLYFNIMNDHDHAIADYNQAIRINPNDAESYAFRGSQYNQKGNHDKALTDFNEAIRLNPQCKNAYTFRACTYFETGVQNKENANYDKAVTDIDKALADIDEALRIEPNDNPASYILPKVRNC